MDESFLGCVQSVSTGLAVLPFVQSQGVKAHVVTRWVTTGGEAGPRCGRATATMAAFEAQARRTVNSHYTWSMTLHPRIRRTVLWGGLVLSALLLVSWGVSERWRVFWYTHPWMVGLQPGGVDIARDPVTMYRMPPGWHASRRVDGSARNWRPRLETGPQRLWIEMPFWLPVIFTISATLAAWRMEAAARRRVRAGACGRCGYSRAGLDAGGLCPECGAKPWAG